MQPQPTARELVAAGWRLIQANDFAGALAPLHRACALHPDDAAAHFLRGACHHALGQLGDALGAFDRAAALEPAHRDAALGAIAVLCELKRATEALPRCARLIAADPGDPLLRLTAGVVHESCGDLAAALACYDAALALDRAYRPALLNRGHVLARLGRLSEAYENNRAAATAFPAEPDSHFNLAEVCLALSRYDEAAGHCERALALAPQHVGALFDRALALASLGSFDAAEASLGAARAADPAQVRALEMRVGGAAPRPLDLREVYLARGFEALKSCDWSGRAAYLDRFARWIDSGADRPLGDTAMCFQAIAVGIDPARQRRLAETVAARLPAAMLPPPPGPRARERIRVAYLSPDFRAHAVGFLVQALPAAHDRRRIEVFAYALNGDDGSAVRARIAAQADVFRDLSRTPSDEAARRIRADDIDVLVDLAGYTFGARPDILARRPARVAMSYLGFPGTTGAAFIDCFVADGVTVPHGAEAFFTERVVRLPRTFWVHDAPEDVPSAPSRAELGLPHDAIVLCAFHNGYKIAPDTFDAWTDVLKASPAAVLWLLDGAGSVRANLMREAAARGIPAERLRFAPALPRAANLARLACADLFLDAFHYNAGANALDALWAGVPVVTAPGAGFAARMAASAVLAAGLPETVANSRDAYVRLVCTLGADGRRRAELRGRLVAGRTSSPLFDTAGRARELEAAYAQAIAHAGKGRGPEAFDVAVPA